MAKAPDQIPDIATRIMEYMVRMPPKPQKDMKLGRGKAKPNRKLANESKTRPASKGRVHKGRTRS